MAERKSPLLKIANGYTVVIPNISIIGQTEPNPQGLGTGYVMTIVVGSLPMAVVGADEQELDLIRGQLETAITEYWNR